MQVSSCKQMNMSTSNFPGIEGSELVCVIGTVWIYLKDGVDLIIGDSDGIGDSVCICENDALLEYVCSLLQSSLQPVVVN